jgi:hypothetical protein
MAARRIICLAGCAVALLAGCEENPPQSNAQPQPSPATQPASRPSTAPVSRAATQPQEPLVLAQYTDILREKLPDFPTTQPMPSSLGLEEAARFEFEEPLFLDAVGCLWIVHERGQSAQEILAGDLKRQTYVINQPVVFTWWKAGFDGKPTVEMILQREDGSFEWLHQTGRAPIPPLADGRAYDWPRAFLFARSLAVPTTGGAAILTPVDRPDPGQYFRRYGRSERRPDGNGSVELAHIALIEPRQDLPATQIRLDGRGLIAWVPFMSRRITGSEKIGRYLDGEWSVLGGDGWTKRPVLLMPLSDGSILQLSIDERNESHLSAVALNAVPVEREAVEKLIENLASTDSREREAAFVGLTNYGPSAWPILEEHLEAASPVVRKQLNILLGDKINPTFGGLMPEPGPVEVRDWLADGGVILRFRNGILLPDGAGVTVLERPAWLLIRPGRRIQLLDPMVVTELSVSEDASAFVWGDEWVICVPEQGAKRWLINHVEPVLDDAHAAWQHFVGMDQVGRWLFRKGPEPGPTLLVDVRLPDPTPRLPIWVIESGPMGEAGYDEEGWPVSKAGSAWRLTEEDWQDLEESDEFYLVNSDVPQEVLARAENGTVYRGGIESLDVVLPDGEQITWKLPPKAVGSGDAKGVLDNEGRLFLFNRPGRVVRIARTSDGPEPFKVEAVFEDEMLPAAAPQHVWLDPAGRICAIYLGNRVAVMWPDGRVPPSIRQKMPAKIHRRPPEDPFRRV